MRNLALVTLAIGIVAAAGPVRAQTYDPDYPVCLQVYGPANYNECRYSSLSQCEASASGRPAQCLINPYFDKGYPQLVGGPHRRLRRMSRAIHRSGSHRTEMTQRERTPPGLAAITLNERLYLVGMVANGTPPLASATAMQCSRS